MLAPSFDVGCGSLRSHRAVFETGEAQMSVEDEIEWHHLKQATWLTAFAHEARLEAATLVAIFLLFGALIWLVVSAVFTIIKDHL
jgi:hypothetical protein